MVLFLANLSSAQITGKTDVERLKAEAQNRLEQEDDEFEIKSKTAYVFIFWIHTFSHSFFIRNFGIPLEYGKTVKMFRVFGDSFAHTQ